MTTPTYFGYVMGRTSGAGISQPITISALASLLQSTGLIPGATNFTTLFASPPPIGSTAPGSASFTTLTAGEVFANSITYSFSGSLTATGSNVSTAVGVGNAVSVFTSVSANTGCQLSSVDSNGAAIVQGFVQKLFNRGSSVLTVYPPTGHSIETQSTNVGVGLAVGGASNYTYAGNNQWYVG